MPPLSDPPHLKTIMTRRISAGIEDETERKIALAEYEHTGVTP